MRLTPEELIRSQVLREEVCSDVWNNSIPLGILLLAATLAACFGYFLPGFSKVELSNHSVVGHVLGVSSPPHMKLVWEMSSDDVLVLFLLNFDHVSQEKQISFFWFQLT